ncbi:alpha/beta fold hydrolase [Catellatospora paridis]|uniref:alpha/beta fold hydrolase n=1 Tax=Catellatospora paridis TaxID=1617086 RepID=UPI0012D4AA6B|nr:alpha/beta hydrolase [Catellatospora paridis]
MTEPKTYTLDVPGAVLHYDVRENTDSTEPVLLLIGSPMDARGFTTLAGFFPDRTVVTYDPRGAQRSIRTADAGESTPDVHAADLHRLIAELGGGPVDIFASSGGAVNALALVAAHPADVRTLVAHEPPAGQVLPDREQALAAIAFIRDLYQAKGLGAGMAAFIAAVGHQGEFPADYAVAPDPAQFGMPAQDDGSRDDVLLGQNLISCTHYEPDFDALRAAPTRIVLAVGEESTGTMAYRGGVAVAEQLGTAAVVFPSNHGGFMGGEFGMPGKPEEFAAKLREVLAENA